MNNITLTDKQIRKYFKNVFGFRVGHTDLYRTALLHKSVSHFTHFGSKDNNERFEFLGDAVLGAIIADYLFQKYPTQAEGKLTQTRSKLVNRTRLNELGRKLGLYELICSNGTNNAKNISGNAFEAVVGAIYKDKGYKKTAEIVIRIFTTLFDIDEIFNENTDYKSSVLIWAQRNKHQIGFKHETIHDEKHDFFKAFLEIDGETISEGEGSTIKNAEQRAAEIAFLEKLV